MTTMNPDLSEYLAAWRVESRQPATAAGREQAHSAMHAALAKEARSWKPFAAPACRWRPLRHRLALAAAVVVAAVTGFAAAGWNAPPGSPLSTVRAVRQIMQLAFPGADQIALHLQYAEQDLSDARNSDDASPSLADAATQLHQAHALLLAQPSSTLWPEWSRDEAALLALQQRQTDSAPPAVQHPVTVPPPAQPRPTAPESEPPRESSAPVGQQPPGDDATAQPSAQPAPSSPEPSASDGAEAGGSTSSGSGTSYTTDH